MDYSAAPGSFRGRGREVECSAAETFAQWFFDIDPERLVDASIGVKPGFTAPVDLAVCRFDSDRRPELSDLAIETTRARDPSNEALSALPQAGSFEVTVTEATSRNLEFIEAQVGVAVIAAP